MILRATLLAALGLFALPTQAQNIDAVQITTTTLSSIVFNNGNMGGDCTGAQEAFVFNGDEGLCSSGFLVGFAADDVVGNSYFLTDETEWTPVGGVNTNVTSPYSDFTLAAELTYENTVSGVSVVHTVYWGDTLPDVILHEFHVFNTSGEDLDGVYMGIHHDWDVGGAVFAQNLAARDGSTMYAWDPTGASTNYFGYSLLVDLSGWGYETTFAGTGQTNEITEADLWAGMTQFLDDTAPAQDQRLVSGSGPYFIPAGGSAVLFAVAAAGESEADLLQNIADVDPFFTADESGPQTVTDALSVPAPNPSSGVARVTLSLDAPEAVRVTVSDVLGRTVATLHEGTLAAGVTPLAVDAAALAPGVYVVRAEGETFRQTRTLTVAR